MPKGIVFQILRCQSAFFFKKKKKRKELKDTENSLSFLLHFKP